METIDISQIFYATGIIFLVLLAGVTLWVSIAINKTLFLVRNLLSKIETTVSDMSMIKEGLKQGIYGLLLKLIERVENNPKK
jgi:hypothetical protein